MFVAPGAKTAFALATPLRDYWLGIGGPASTLGYPISNSQPNPSNPGAWTAKFTGGQASWDPTTGQGSNCPTNRCLIFIPLPSFNFILNP